MTTDLLWPRYSTSSLHIRRRSAMPNNFGNVRSSGRPYLAWGGGRLDAAVHSRFPIADQR